jgi:transcriptional regulator of acetoin/glycerol metabolism
VNELLEQRAPSRGPVDAPGAPPSPSGAEQGRDDAGDEARGALLTTEEVEWCLAKTGDNVKAAAKVAGISRPAFYRAMKRLGVTRKKGR